MNLAISLLIWLLSGYSLMSSGKSLYQDLPFPTRLPSRRPIEIEHSARPAHAPLALWGGTSLRTNCITGKPRRASLQSTCDDSDSALLLLVVQGGRVLPLMEYHHRVPHYLHQTVLQRIDHFQQYFCKYAEPLELTACPLDLSFKPTNVST